jgi:hypothetical protein
MASLTWDGQVGANWSSALNWSTNSLPANSDSVFINNAAVTQPTLDVNSNFLNNTIVSAGSLTVNATLTSIAT